MVAESNNSILLLLHYDMCSFFFKFPMYTTGNGHETYIIAKLLEKISIMYRVKIRDNYLLVTTYGVCIQSLSTNSSRHIHKSISNALWNVTASSLSFLIGDLFRATPKKCNAGSRTLFPMQNVIPAAPSFVYKSYLNLIDEQVLCLAAA
jgi:hypothetical protein